MKLELYRALHIASILVLVSSMTAVLTTEKKSALANIVLGISSMVVFVAGFGLLHLSGTSMHSHWVLGKIVVWVIVAGTSPVIAKRKPEWRRGVLAVNMLLLIGAIGLVVFKP